MDTYHDEPRYEGNQFLDFFERHERLIRERVMDIFGEFGKQLSPEERPFQAGTEWKRYLRGI